MVKVLPPYQVETPEYVPGQAISVAPAGHTMWLDDYEYWDQLGRDPMQTRKLWLIKEPEERLEKFKELLEDYPKQRHRRQMLQTCVKRGDEAFVRHLVGTGLVIQPDVEESKKQNEAEEQKKMEDDYEDTGELPDIPNPTVAPAHLAAHHNKFECLKIMIEEGNVDVDARDEFGRTLLLAAASADNPEMVRYLLGKGANPTARTISDGELADEYLGMYAGADTLEMAAAKGNVEVLRLLLEHPFYGSTRKRKFRETEEPGVWVTPLAIKSVAGSRNIDALQLLLERGAYPLETKDGKSKIELLSEQERKTIDDAIPMALSSGDVRSLKMLLSFQHPVDDNGDLITFEVPKDLQKPFTWAAYEAMEKDDIEKFEFVHAFGVKQHDTMSLDSLPEGQHLNIQHLFEKAAECGSVNCMKHLVKNYKADPDFHRIPCGVKPLFVAAAKNQFAAVKYLLEECIVDIHAASGRFATGPTALGTAVWLQSIESVKLLLEHGGPVDYIDDDLREIKKPIKAILRGFYENDRGKIHLETEEHAKKHVEEARNDYMQRIPRYVRVEFEPADQKIIDGLQMRRSDEELRETGERAREFSEKEAVKDEDLDDEDPRRLMAPIPTYLDRESEVKTDEDLIPEFKPFLKFA